MEKAMAVDHDSSPAELPTNLDTFEAEARARLPGAVYDYYAGGAEDERTLELNRSAFRQLVLRPRVLVDVGAVDTSVSLLGQRAAFPVLVAPTAFHRLAHPEGELATARATADAGTIMVASTLATHRIEDIAAAAPGAVWLQVYVFRDRAITAELVQRARQAGCRALCLTVDVAVQAKRERDARNRFTLPPGIEMANFQGLAQARLPEALGSGLGAFIAREFDPTLTWDVVGWLHEVSGLPVLVKGVATEEDGRLAVEHGAAGVVVSNHGGRQLDSAEPTLQALPHVAEGVADRVPVLLDGGVRRGTDVVKALALGARAVLVGRPILWGLAVGGQQGVARVLALLREEVERTMALMGRTATWQMDRCAVADALEPLPPIAPARS
jgi:isopentenyl diphosphate isomerase/L-lactate dehydrogenase-like FMN-dependent dehydrogenase